MWGWRRGVSVQVCVVMYIYGCAIFTCVGVNVQHFSSTCELGNSYSGKRDT